MLTTAVPSSRNTGWRIRTSPLGNLVTELFDLAEPAAAASASPSTWPFIMRTAAERPFCSRALITLWIATVLSAVVSWLARA